MNDKIKEVLEVIKQKTYNDLDEVTKDIEKSIKHTRIEWNISKDIIYITIDNVYKIIIKSKVHYSIDSVLIDKES